MNKNYYDILGVSSNASQDDIKKAYRDLCKKYHPDVNGGDDTKFKEINEAYNILGNEQSKREYDMQSNGFNSFFGRNSFTLARDISMTFTVSIQEAHNGCSRTIHLNNRTFTVEIPKGSVNGKLLKIEGLGQSGYNLQGKPATGDLIITIKIQNNDSKIYLNDNGLLEVMCAVDWIDAILGSEMTMDILGEDVTFRVPKFTQNGGYTMVGGKGFHKFKSDEKGTLKVNFIVKMPKTLTDENMNLLKKIKESL